MQLVLNTKGIHLKRHQGRFEIQNGEEMHRISPHKVTSIAVTRSCTIDTDAILLAIEHEIPILLLNRFGKVIGRLWSAHFTSIASLRRRQVFFAESSDAVHWVRELLMIKLIECGKVLAYIAKKRSGLRPEIKNVQVRLRQQEERLRNVSAERVAEVRNRFMGIEGSSMRSYWQLVGQVLPEPLQFDKRSRRPAQDGFNAALNYLYGMLYSVVEGALFAVGLDPHLGILHVDQHDSPTLAFDLIEPFRPWVDRLVIEYAVDGYLGAELFDAIPEGVLVSKAGKQLLIPAFNDHFQEHYRFRERQTSRERHIYQAAARLAKLIRGTEANNLNLETS